jgi:hypothetical protein
VTDLIARLKLIRSRRHRTEAECEATVEEIELAIRELEQWQITLQRKGRSLRDRVNGVVD